MNAITIEGRRNGIDYVLHYTPDQDEQILADIDARSDVFERAYLRWMFFEARIKLRKRRRRHGLSDKKL